MPLPLPLPTTEQLAAVLEAADPAFRPFVALAAFAGLRLGEAAGLQVRDVDFLRRTITVQRQVQRTQDAGVEVRAPKYGSERSVYASDLLLEMLSQRIAERRPGDDAERHLFLTTDGRLLHQNNVGHYWRMACRRAGLP